MNIIRKNGRKDSRKDNSGRDNVHDIDKVYNKGHVGHAFIKGLNWLEGLSNGLLAL